MVSGGVVDALMSAHRTLRDDGLVLDLQPEPGDPPIEVVRGGRVIGSVPHDETWCTGQILRTRAAGGACRGRLLVAERSLDYERLQHASMIDEWAEYRAAKGKHAHRAGDGHAPANGAPF
jgi:hypothetical protein